MSRASTVARRAGALLTSLPVRFLISVTLLAAVAASIDWGALSETLSDAGWGWFATAVACVLGALVLGALRWQALLRAAPVARPLRETVRAYGAGAFSNNFLPTGFGGDAVRAWMVGRSGMPLARSLASVAVDRASALACLLLIAWGGVLGSTQSIPASFVALLAAATIAMAGVAVLLAVGLRHRALRRLLPRFLQPWAREVAGVLRRYATDRRLAAQVVVLGLAFQGLTVAALWMLAESLQLRVALGLLAAIAPLVLIATILPISIAGFGVREGAFVALLAEVGVSSTDATLLSLFSVAAMALASLPGGLALLTRSPAVAPGSEEPPKAPRAPQRML